MLRTIRFRTLGCWPLSGAVLSNSQHLGDMVRELMGSRHSERQGRMIDHDGAVSMERKNREGYS